MEQNVVILLAEDNPGHAILTTKHLKRAGIANMIHHFQNGEELLEFLEHILASQIPFSNGRRFIIIMDLKMPKMDGLRTMEILKKNPFFSVIPVIIFSTSDDPNEIYECYQKGCNGYVVKPVISADFTDFISNLVSYFKIIKIPVIMQTKGITEEC
jgi:CheY-like chemotaxis protein